MSVLDYSSNKEILQIVLILRISIHCCFNPEVSHKEDERDFQESLTDWQPLRMLTAIKAPVIPELYDFP